MSGLAFQLPRALEATEPPEARGICRDAVRLMVAGADGDIVHAHFRDLPHYLRPGDLLVINTSATVPAAVPARRSDGTPVEVHFSTRAPHADRDDRFVIELRTGDGERLRSGAAEAGEPLRLPGAATLRLLAPYAAPGRFWLARFSDADLQRYLEAHGDPIRYGYVPRPWPLSAYQTVYATAPGSAEMPSAGRPFTTELITALLGRGILFAPITLHCGVSSPEHDEPPYAEEFLVPEVTAGLVNAVREWGGRVVAVGTTVVRALESAAGSDGRVRAADGWTDLVISPDHRPAVVGGLLTGWHEPGASHLQMLEAIAGRSVIDRSYAAALARGYLWHEFGDSHLVLAAGSI